MVDRVVRVVLLVMMPRLRYPRMVVLKLMSVPFASATSRREFLPVFVHALMSVRRIQHWTEGFNVFQARFEGVDKVMTLARHLRSLSLKASCEPRHDYMFRESVSDFVRETDLVGVSVAIVFLNFVL